MVTKGFFLINKIRKSKSGTSAVGPTPELVFESSLAACAKNLHNIDWETVVDSTWMVLVFRLR